MSNVKRFLPLTPLPTYKFLKCYVPVSPEIRPPRRSEEREGGNELGRERERERHRDRDRSKIAVPRGTSILNRFRLNRAPASDIQVLNRGPAI